MKTVQELIEMNSADLRKAAGELGIKNASTYKKDILLQMCANVINKVSTPEQTQQAADALPNLEPGENPITKPVYEFESPISKPAPSEINEEEIRITNTPNILSDENQGIVNSPVLNKSAKIRALYQNGLPTAVIAKALGIRYNFAYNVIERFK